MNLVDSVKQTLGGAVLGKLSDVLGAGKEETESAIGAAVPALLSGIGSLVSKPEGAEKVWGAVQGVDDSLLGNLGDLLGGEKTEAVESMGSGILESLFSKGTVAALVAALGSYLGGKSNLVSKLLPLLAPVIMGALSKKVKSDGLDLGGLVKVILGQKDNFAKAMPAGLGSALSGVQGLGEFSPATGVVNATSRTAHDTASSDSPSKWFVPLIVILVVGGLVWWLMNRTTDETQDAAAKVTEVSGDFRDLFTNMNVVLGDVTDTQSAQDALPKLQDMDTKLETLAKAFQGLPEASQPAVEKVVSDSMEDLESKKDEVLGIPGVGDILRTVLNAIFEKLSALVKG